MLFWLHLYPINTLLMCSSIQSQQQMHLMVVFMAWNSKLMLPFNSLWFNTKWVKFQRWNRKRTTNLVFAFIKSHLSASKGWSKIEHAIIGETNYFGKMSAYCSSVFSHTFFIKQLEEGNIRLFSFRWFTLVCFSSFALIHNKNCIKQRKTFTAQ